VAHGPSHHEANSKLDDDEGDGASHAGHVDAAELPPVDEGKTPLWLTALGGGLFVLLAIGWLAARPAGLTLSQLSPPPPPPTQEEAPPPAPAALPPATVVPPQPEAPAAAPPSTVPAKAAVKPAKKRKKPPAAEGQPVEPSNN
jgi:hypothetical protein